MNTIARIKDQLTAHLPAYLRNEGQSAEDEKQQTAAASLPYGNA